MRLPSVLIGAVLLLGGALAPVAAPSEPAAGEVATGRVADRPRVLVWGGTYGFRHSSITTGERTMVQLAEQTGDFDVTVTENPADLTMSTLRDYDVLMWISTTGKAPLSDQQREDIMRWSSCGGGNLGIHAVLDSEYGWAEHARLFGARFDSHPHGAAAPAARVLVEGRRDRTMAGWAGRRSFELADEYYRWRGARGYRGISLPRNDPGTEVLLSLDETTVASGIQRGPQPYEHHQPIAWKKTYGRGRVFYTNMGHNESTWAQRPFQRSLLNALPWLSAIGPDAACLRSDGPLPRAAKAPAPRPRTIGRACSVPRRSETNAASRPRRVSTTDRQRLGGGLPGNLAWGSQTWVVDLSRSGARRADVTIDLDWTLPTDDYDLSVTTGWELYGSDNPVGTTHERVVLRGVPHCAVVQVAGDNLAAASMGGTTARIAVVPRRDR